MNTLKLKWYWARTENSGFQCQSVNMEEAIGKAANYFKSSLYNRNKRYIPKFKITKGKLPKLWYCL